MLDSFTKLFRGAVTKMDTDEAPPELKKSKSKTISVTNEEARELMLKVGYLKDHILSREFRGVTFVLTYVSDTQDYVLGKIEDDGTRSRIATFTSLDSLIEFFDSFWSGRR